jgi:hypothetical protein
MLLVTLPMLSSPNEPTDAPPGDAGDAGAATAAVSMGGKTPPVASVALCLGAGLAARPSLASALVSPPFKPAALLLLLAAAAVGLAAASRWRERLRLGDSLPSELRSEPRTSLSVAFVTPCALSSPKLSSLPDPDDSLAAALSMAALAALAFAAAARMR